MSMLFIYPRKGEASTFGLSGKSICLGRDPNNDIVLSDQFSSGRHAVILSVANGYVVEDQGSKNGTFLNGSRLAGKAPLREGDEITIGSTRILFGREPGIELAMIDDSTLSSGMNTIIGVKDILKGQSETAFPRIERGNPVLEALHREQKFVTVLGEVSRALIYHMNLGELLKRVADLITDNIPMDRCVLMLKEKAPDEFVPRMVRIVNDSLKTQNVIVSRSILRTAVNANSSVLVSDIQSDRQLSLQESIVAAQIRSAMCVPMWNNKEIIGMIYSDRTAILGQFSEEDLKLLTVLANLAALKIENTQLFEESQKKAQMEQELMMAQKIQKGFLPRCDPVFDPYDISGSTRPCYHVGGDYFDYIPINASELGAVIADVSGHGVSAGLLMTSLRASLHALFPANRDLAALAAKLNNTVHSNSDSHTFISFFLCVLVNDKGEMSYVNAGHNPPLLLNTDGKVRSLEPTGPCLGMFPNASYRTNTIEIKSGEVLCLFTDGIVEGKNDENEEYGDDRLIRRLRDHMTLSARDILAGIYEDVSGFSACVEPSDDLTLMIIKRKAQGSG
jgi:sigma-B regulation protein RsbU (phosphoserine phosphatase)